MTAKEKIIETMLKSGCTYELIETDVDVSAKIIDAGTLELTKLLELCKHPINAIISILDSRLTVYTYKRYYHEL